MKVLHCVDNRIFDLVLLLSCDLELDQMTFIYEINPYSLNTVCTRCVKMNFLCQGFRKLSYYTHTDRHD